MNSPRRQFRTQHHAVPVKTDSMPAGDAIELVRSGIGTAAVQVAVTTPQEPINTNRINPNQPSTDDQLLSAMPRQPIGGAAFEPTRPRLAITGIRPIAATIEMPATPQEPARTRVESASPRAMAVGGTRAELAGPRALPVGDIRAKLASPRKVLVGGARVGPRLVAVGGARVKPAKPRMVNAGRTRMKSDKARMAIVDHTRMKLVGLRMVVVGGGARLVGVVWGGVELA